MKRLLINLFLVFSLFSTLSIGGCKKSHKVAPQPVVQEQLDKYVQKNVITDPKKQLDLVKKTVGINYRNSYYVYDTKRWGLPDRWDDTSKQLKEAFKRFKSQNNISKVAKQDCEDTALTLIISLIENGFPYNQLELHFVMVPMDTAGNVGSDGEMVGHAIVVAYIDGQKPYVLEQLSYIRTLERLHNTRGYRFIAMHDMGDPLELWYETNQSAIEYFSKGYPFTLDMIQ